MGLQQNLQDIQTNLLQAKTAIAQSISNKGVECSADDQLSSFASKIDSITTGGTGEKFVVPDGLKFGYSTSFDPTMFDVSNVTDMSRMFYICSGLTGELNLSSWNVDNVINMSSIFNRCSKLTNINVSTWNTSQVTNMNGMFFSGTTLASINISNFNTSNVTDMGSMFSSCTGLTKLDLSNFNTSNVTNMGGMFSSCTGLTELNVSNFNTSNVTNMYYMFSSCMGLTELDLSNFNTSNVTDMGGMFSSCGSLTNLQLNDLGRNEQCKKLDLSYCSKLTKDSILFLFNNAFDRTAAGYTTAFTITLNATTKALLSEDEIAIATSKGFTVA